MRPLDPSRAGSALDKSLWERVQARLEQNSVERPSGREWVDHEYLLEGILRCGRCSTLMTRSSATDRTGGRYFYYRCGNKHRTAATKCDVRDVPVDAVETFVIEQVKHIAATAGTVEAAVLAANVEAEQEQARLKAVSRRKLLGVAKIEGAGERGLRLRALVKRAGC